MATSLKNSQTALEYDIPHKDITDSTAQKPSKRAFLKRFVDFRHHPPHHFSDAFKNCNAPRTALIENDIHYIHLGGLTT